MNSSDDIAYLPPNCFLVKVIDPEGPTSSKLLELVISTSFASLMKDIKRRKQKGDQFSLMYVTNLWGDEFGRSQSSGDQNSS